MNGLFWLLLIHAVLTFGLMAWLTDKALCAVQRRWRHWRVGCELKQLRSHTLGSYRPIPRGEQTRRRQLDALATSQDRYSRRIH